MKQINLYSKAICLKEVGVGAWASILEYKQNTKELSGANPSTTEKQMHLVALIEGLKTLKEPCEVHILSSSIYIINSINKSLDMWMENSWKTKEKKNIANIELWKEYLNASKLHTIKAKWVKDNAVSAHNKRCGILARTQAEKLK